MQLNTDILQLLQSCVGEVPRVFTGTVFNFPLQEFFYEVLSGGVEVNERFYSLDFLPEAVLQYHDDHPSCQLTADILLAEGWLAPFLNRWDFSVWPSDTLMNDSQLETDLNQRIDLLCWLKRMREEYGEISVPHFDKILAQFRSEFPEMPDADWFIQEGFLSTVITQW